MSEPAYEYDVAISFLADDESLAVSLADSLRDRLRVFLFSERQKELAGKDGLEEFTSVFGEKARVVTVLYRQGWGTTRWTRVEETAIKNRAFDRGWEFLVVVSLDTSRAPAWLPKTKLWLGFDRYGMPGAASVVEARVQETGGQVREENAIERAERLARIEKNRAERDAFLDSPAGVHGAKAQVAEIFELLQAQVDTLAKLDTPFKVRLIKTDRDACFVTSNRVSLSFGWSCQFSNTLRYSGLYVAEYPDPYIPPEFRPDTKISGEATFRFTVDRSGLPAWSREADPDRTFSSQALVEHYLKRLLDRTIEAQG
jgi:hypothetical protein